MFIEELYPKIVVLIKNDTNHGGLARNSETFENATFRLTGDYLIICELVDGNYIYTPIRLSIIDSYKTFNK